MTSRPLFFLLLVLSVTLPPPGPAAEATAVAARPNVLFLFADDMRADSIAAPGNPVVKTGPGHPVAKNFDADEGASHDLV